MLHFISMLLLTLYFIFCKEHPDSQTLENHARNISANEKYLTLEMWPMLDS